MVASQCSDALQLAALCGARDGLRRAHIGIDLSNAHRVGRLSSDGTSESLEIVPHRGMRRHRMHRWRFAAVRNGDVPPRRVLGMSAIANLNPALRAVNG